VRISNALSRVAGVVKIFPSSTNFILFQHTLGLDTHQRLLDQGLFLNDCASLAPGMLRLSLRSPSENDLVLQAISALGEV